MRKPTPTADLYAWHRAALAGDEPEIHPGDPQCGWFELRLVRGGPLVGCRIFVEREIDPDTGELLCDERLVCEVGTRRITDFIDIDDQFSWLSRHPISEELYDYRRDRAAWAGWYEPSAPEANPRQKIDFGTIPAPTFERKA